MFIRMAKDNYLWYWESMVNTEKIQAATGTMEGVFKGVHDNAALLNQTSTNLSEFSGDMTRNAANMSAKLSGVAGIAEKVNTNSSAMVSLMAQATNNFSNIASATEEMTATNEVAKNINEASAGFYSANQMMEENDEGLKQVSHDISQLETTATGVETGAAQVDQNAETLLTLAGEMVRMVDSPV
jgi:methyl-accepting chemotaxis protein